MRRTPFSRLGARCAAWSLPVTAFFFAASSRAQAPLPPLPDAPAPAPAPPPAGAAQDVTVLPPLPPPAPAPVSTPPAPPAPAPTPAAPPPPAAPAPAPPPAAPVDEVSRHGLSFGLRVALGIPIGEVNGQPSSSTETVTANNLSNEFALLFPVTLDVGYRLTPRFYVGGYFAFGIGTPPSVCTNNSSQCDQNDVRFGLEAKYMAAPAALIDPWVGAGVGWEIANQSEGDLGAGHASGPEFLHLRAGLDFKLGPHIYGGPEAMFTFATFTDVQTPGASVTLHDWFTIGVSGHYDL